MSDETTTALVVQVKLDNSDDEELDNLTRQLRSELLDLETESVDYISPGSAPPGTKGAELVLGALVVSMAPKVLTKALDFLHAWVMRREGRTVKIKVQAEGNTSIEIEVPGAMSPAEVRAWIDSVSESLPKKR